MFNVFVQLQSSMQHQYIFKYIERQFNSNLCLNVYSLTHSFVFVLTACLSGQAFLSISPLQISALTIISSCLWLGTSSGAIFSIPLTISELYSYTILLL